MSAMNSVSWNNIPRVIVETFREIYKEIAQIKDENIVKFRKVKMKRRAQDTQLESVYEEIGTLNKRLDENNDVLGHVLTTLDTKLDDQTDLVNQMVAKTTNELMNQANETFEVSLQNAINDMKTDVTMNMKDLRSSWTSLKSTCESKISAMQASITNMNTQLSEETQAVKNNVAELAKNAQTRYELLDSVVVDLDQMKSDSFYTVKSMMDQFKEEVEENIETQVESVTKPLKILMDQLTSETTNSQLKKMSEQQDLLEKENKAFRTSYNDLKKKFQLMQGQFEDEVIQTLKQNQKELDILREHDKDLQQSGLLQLTKKAQTPTGDEPEQSDNVQNTTNDLGPSEARLWALETRLRKEEKHRIKQNLTLKGENETLRSNLNRTIEKLRVHVLNTAIVSARQLEASQRSPKSDAQSSLNNTIESKYQNQRKPVWRFDSLRPSTAERKRPQTSGNAPISSKPQTPLNATQKVEKNHSGSQLDISNIYKDYSPDRHSRLHPERYVHKAVRGFIKPSSPRLQF